MSEERVPSAGTRFHSERSSGAFGSAGVASALLLLSLATAPTLVATPNPKSAKAGTPDPQLAALVAANDLVAVRERGRAVLPDLLSLYRAGSEDERAQVAAILYGLGWESPEAEALLMKDVHTEHESLRLQVQWALGRVSDSPIVVETLLENMMSDPNPLFRDKAACALAYDQIHLSDPQKVRLFEGLIAALSDPKGHVRRIALQALRIHTGQTMNFVPARPPAQQTEAIEAWKAWLEEYREAL